MQARGQPRVLEDETMYPSEHPTAAMVLARHRMQEDIARAEAARAARTTRAIRVTRSRAWSPRTGSRAGWTWPFAALRAALGRA